MKEHIKEYARILRKFKEAPYEVLENDKDKAKLIAAINKSLKVLQKTDGK